MRSSPGTPHSFLTLDGMRGVAALVIVFWHADSLFGFRPASGYLAVDLFFVLSGFVLAHAYDRRFDSGMTATEFMRIRLIRLYPLYFLAFVVAMAALLGSLGLGQPSGWTPATLTTTGLLSLGFMPTPRTFGAYDFLYPLNAPAWSLGYELLINLLFALTWRFLSTRVLVSVVAAAGLALIVDSAVYGSLDVGSKWATALGAFPRVLYSFPLGVLLLRLHRRYGARLTMPSTLPVLAMLMVLAIEPPPEMRMVYDALCVVVVFPGLVFIAAKAQPTRLASLYAFLGLTSYAVYALNFPMLRIVERVVVKIAHGNLQAAWPLVGILFVTAVVVAAYVADVVYDGPARKWLSARAWPDVSRRRRPAT